METESETERSELMSPQPAPSETDPSEQAEEEQDAVEVIEPGAAIRKMQQLAQEIYESTPGIG